MRGLTIGLGACVTALAIGALAPPASAGDARTPLLIYTAYSPEDLPQIEEAFERAHPDVDLTFHRDSVGVIVARLLAEKDNRQADLVTAIAPASMLRLKAEGMLEAYAPKGIERYDPRFVDSDDPPYWAGMGIFTSVVCLNSAEAGAKGLPAPRAWADLVDSAYRGEIVMADPSFSDSALLTVTAWLQMMGEERGWQFMDELDRNIDHYTKSGSAAARAVAAGEFPLTITIDTVAARTKRQGAPIEILLMSEGHGWEVDAFAILKGTPHLAAAKAFADWSASDEAIRFYGRSYSILPVAGIAPSMPELPADIVDHMTANDLGWAIANRERVQAEWTRRYGARTR